ncbi:unnamed protein product [Sphagnum balticum]
MISLLRYEHMLIPPLKCTGKERQKNTLQQIQLINTQHLDPWNDFNLRDRRAVVCTLDDCPRHPPISSAIDSASISTTQAASQKHITAPSQRRGRGREGGEVKRQYASPRFSSNLEKKYCTEIQTV